MAKALPRELQLSDEALQQKAVSDAIKYLALKKESAKIEAELELLAEDLKVCMDNNTVITTPAGKVTLSEVTRSQVSSEYTAYSTDVETVLTAGQKRAVFRKVPSKSVLDSLVKTGELDSKVLEPFVQATTSPVLRCTHKK